MNWKQAMTAPGMLLLLAVREACMLKGASWQGCSKHCWGSSCWDPAAAAAGQAVTRAPAVWFGGAHSLAAAVVLFGGM